MSRAEVELTSLVKLYTKMKTEFAKTAKFFSEDPGAVNIDDFFCIFATFIVDFEVRENKHFNINTK